MHLQEETRKMIKNNTQLSDVQILLDRMDETNEKRKVKKVTYDDKHIYAEYIRRAKKSKRNSKIDFRLNKFREGKKNQTLYEQIKFELEKVQLSAKYHWFIISLVAIDCFCIATELLIEFIELSLVNEEFYLTKEQILKDMVKFNDTHILLSKLNNYLDKLHDTSDIHKLLFYSETFFKYLGTVILGVFIVEFFIKAIFLPMSFLVKIWEFVDGFIVVLSFTLNIYLFNRKHAVHSLIGLITLVRLWRITEIVNAIVMVIETKNENKIEKLYKTIKFLDSKNEELTKRVLDVERREHDCTSSDSNVSISISS